MRGEEEGREEDGEDGPPAGRSHRVGMIMRALFSVIQLARSPSFEAPIHFFKHFCTMCATLCAGPLISQELDRTAGSKRAHKGVPCAQPYAPGTEF